MDMMERGIIGWRMGISEWENGICVALRVCVCGWIKITGIRELGTEDLIGHLGEL
jgi:hypothetical protein